MCVAEHYFPIYEQQSLGWTKLDNIADFDWAQKKFDLPNTVAIRQVFGEKDKLPALKMVPKIVEILQTFDSYQAHRGSIENYITAIFDNRKYSPKLKDNW
jgi:hypothetical protein